MTHEAKLITAIIAATLATPAFAQRYCNETQGITIGDRIAALYANRDEPVRHVFIRLDSVDEAPRGMTGRVINFTAEGYTIILNDMEMYVTPKQITVKGSWKDVVVPICDMRR